MFAVVQGKRVNRWAVLGRDGKMARPRFCCEEELMRLMRWGVKNREESYLFGLKKKIAQLAVPGIFRLRELLGGRTRGA